MTTETALLIIMTVLGAGRFIGQLGDPRDVSKYAERLGLLEQWRGTVERDIEKHSQFRDTAVRRLADIEAALRQRDRDEGHNR